MTGSLLSILPFSEQCGWKGQKWEQLLWLFWQRRVWRGMEMVPTEVMTSSLRWTNWKSFGRTSWRLWITWKSLSTNWTILKNKLPMQHRDLKSKGLTKCVTRVLALSQWGVFDSAKSFVTHCALWHTLEIWTLIQAYDENSVYITEDFLILSSYSFSREDRSLLLCLTSYPIKNQSYFDNIRAFDKLATWEGRW